MTLLCGSSKNSACFQLRPEKRLYIWPSLSETCLRPEKRAFLWPLPAQSRRSGALYLRGFAALCLRGFAAFCLWVSLPFGFRVLLPFGSGFSLPFGFRVSVPFVSEVSVPWSVRPRGSLLTLGPSFGPYGSGGLF